MPHAQFKPYAQFKPAGIHFRPIYTRHEHFFVWVGFAKFPTNPDKKMQNYMSRAVRQFPCPRQYSFGVVYKLLENA